MKLMSWLFGEKPTPVLEPQPVYSTRVVEEEPLPHGDWLAELSKDDVPYARVRVSCISRLRAHST